MKYSKEFIKQNKKFPTEEVQRVLEKTDAHYSTMVKLVGFYDACGRTMPKHNVFEEEMKEAQITIDMICIASVYFKYAKKRDRAAMQAYIKNRNKLLSAPR